MNHNTRKEQLRTQSDGVKGQWMQIWGILFMIKNQSLVRKTISKRWNLRQFLKEASEVDNTTEQLRDMKNTTGSTPRKQNWQRNPPNHVQKV